MEKTLHRSEYRILLKLLRQARLDAGITQDELAHRLDYPRSTITKCETGHQRLDILEFWQWCEELGADPLAVLTTFHDMWKRKKTAPRRRTTTPK